MLRSNLMLNFWMARYPQWLANIIPFPKKDGNVLMCVDYRYLNWASVKDDFRSPYINILVDNVARHSNFTFMDSFWGYNQIKMEKKDKGKKPLSLPLEGSSFTR